MIIENARTIVKNRLVGLAISFAFMLAITIILVSGYSSDLYFGISKYYFAIVLGAVYILYNIYVLLLNRNYINYSDETEKIEFKYYSTNPFSFKNHYIVVNKNNLLRYDLKKFLGIKYDLVLYQKSSKGEAKYPSISLSAMSDDEIHQLVSSLNNYIPKP
jgi:hypothetical protein